MRKLTLRGEQPGGTVGRFIYYKSDYKHQLDRPYETVIELRPPREIETPFVSLGCDGSLRIAKGYAWDGPSGPVADTKETMRASLVHDALYQLMRLRKLDRDRWRKTADRIFRDMCKEDGVSSFRAKVYYKGLREFGKKAASPSKKKRVYRAPKATR